MRLSTTLFYAAKGNGSQVSRTRQTGLKQGLGLAHVCYKTITDFLYFIKNRLLTHWFVLQFVERGRTLSLWRDSLRTIRSTYRPGITIIITVSGGV